MLQLKLEVDPLAWPSSAELRKALESALKIWAAYFKRRVDHRFQAEGPGWAPRKAESDLKASLRTEKASSLAEHRLRRKLEQDVTRAERRAASGKGKAESAARRYAVLKEFERQVRGGMALPADADKGDRRLSKSVAGLKERKARAEIATAGRILGGIANSTKTKVSRGEAAIYSSIPWSGVQDQGGTVGKGAVLPARSAYYVDSEDLAMLAEIASNRLLAVFGAA